MKKLFPSLFANFDVSSFKCDVCELAKSHRASFPLTLTKSPIPFMIIHYDVWGPSKFITLDGSCWFVTFIDDCTGMTWVCLMKSNSEVKLLFQKFHKMVCSQYNAQVQVLHSDNGGEYLSFKLKRYLEAHGTIHQTTCSDTPKHNGVAERKNRHLLEVVRASLIEAHMTLSYWGHALTSAAYLINRVHSSTIDFRTPSQALIEAIVALIGPNLPPHVFGCVAVLHLHKRQHNKLTPRALLCVILGYAAYQKGYRCYHPPSKRMFVTMDEVFHEDSMYFSSEPELQGEHLEEVQALDYDFLISIEGELSEPGNNMNGNEKERPKIGNENAGELDLSGINLNHSGDERDEDLDNEVVDQPPSESLAPQVIDTPNQSPAEDGRAVVSEPPRKQLPLHQTRGIPKPTYEPKLSSKVKYPISHYVSNHRLSESNKSFVNQLSTVFIPHSVQEALADPRWKAAMNEEMKSL